MMSMILVDAMMQCLNDCVYLINALLMLLLYDILVAFGCLNVNAMLDE